MSKVYRGRRSTSGAQVMVHQGSAAPHALMPRLDLRQHSLDGFNFGYGGSGPSQLALALCADALGDDARAQRVYHEFKWRFIAPLQDDAFEISADEVVRLVESIERNERAS